MNGKLNQYSWMMKMDKLQSGIYAIQNLVNGKVYIGQAVNIKRRKNGHYGSLRRGKHANKHLQRAWNKYGESAFEFKVLTRCDGEDLNHFEDKAFNIYRGAIGWDMMYNNAEKAGSCLGVKPSPETRAKMSAAGKGKIISSETRAKMSAAAKGKNKGKKHSLETRTKMSAASKGKKKSPEHRAKIAASNKGKNKGRKLSPEHRAKLSAAGKGNNSRKGMKNSPEARAKVSAALKGRKHSPEHIAKVVASRKGYTPSPETRAKISAANRGHGRPWSPARRKAWEERKLKMPVPNPCNT